MVRGIYQVPISQEPRVNEDPLQELHRMVPQVSLDATRFCVCRFPGNISGGIHARSLVCMDFPEPFQ